jgi:ATP-dependent helicase/nuclease subunit B
VKRAIVVGRTRNFIEEVSSLVPEGSTDYGSTIVIFPGRRPGYFLLRSLARKLQSAFIPPRMFSLDGFVEFLHREHHGGTFRPLSDIDAVATLYRLHANHPSPYGGSHFNNFPSFYPLGRKLFREFEELIEGGITPLQFHTAVRGGGRKELEPVADLFRQFYAELREKGFATRALRYDAVCHGAIPVDEESQVIIAGVHSTTRAVDSLLRTLLGRARVQLILQEGPQASRTLRMLGIEAEYREGEQRRPVVSMSHGTDCHAQVYGASAVVRDLLRDQDVADEGTVFVLPEAGTLFPVIHHILPLMRNGRFNISMGYPVTRTPVYGFIESLMHLAGGSEDGKLYAPDYLRFCLHPFTKNIRWRDRDDVTRIVFHTIERAFEGSKAKRFFTLEELENDSALLGKCAEVLLEAGLSPGDIREHLSAIHANTIGTISRPESIGDLADRVIRVLAFISEHSTAHRHWLYATFVSTLTVALEEIAGSSLRTMTLRTPSEYFRFLRSHLETARVPFRGTPLDGVQVLGLPETVCLSFKRVFIFDANDDVLPGPPKHYVISSGLRTALGLPTPADAEQAVEQNISSLVGGADEAFLFYTSKGRREKSRYLERMIWEREKKSRPVPIGVLQYATRLDTVVPGPIPKTEEVLGKLHAMSFSASALDTYLHCGLQFFYRYILRLQEKEGLTTDIERSDIGSFVHRILALYFRPSLGQVLTEDDVDGDRLDEMIDREFSAEYGDESIGGRFLLKHQIKRHLKDFMQHYQVPVIREHHPMLEGLETRWDASFGAVKFTGFTDRIERRGNRLFILDYKTGTRTENINFRKLDPADRATWPKAIGSFQLPLYLLLYHHRTGTPREDIIPAYLMLGRNRIGMEIEKPFIEKGGPESYLLIENIMMALVEEIHNLQYPFQPTADVAAHCPRCPFTTICGTRWAEAPQFS